MAISRPKTTKKQQTLNKKRNIPKQPKPATDGKHLLKAVFIMSVTSQIKSDWKLAIEKALPPKIIDRTNQIQIAIDCRDNEYFIHDDTGNEKTFRVTRPDGINCSVWKKGFRIRWVDSDYCLKPIVW